MQSNLHKNIEYQRKLEYETTINMFQATCTDLSEKYSNIFVNLNSLRRSITKQSFDTNTLFNETGIIKENMENKQEKVAVGSSGDEITVDKNKNLVTTKKDNYILLSRPELGIISFTKREYIENSPIFTTTNVKLYPDYPKSGGILTTNGNVAMWSNQNFILYELPTYEDTLPKGRLYREGDHVKIKL